MEDSNINYFKELELSNIKFDNFFDEIFADPKNNRNIGRIGDNINLKSVAGKIH